MIHRPNVTLPSQPRGGQNQEEWQRSECVLGYIPVVYYSVLLCVGVPGTVGGEHQHITLGLHILPITWVFCSMLGNKK